MLLLCTEKSSLAAGRGEAVRLSRRVGEGVHPPDPTPRRTRAWDRPFCPSCLRVPGLGLQTQAPPLTPAVKDPGSLHTACGPQLSTCLLSKSQIGFEVRSPPYTLKRLAL